MPVQVTTTVITSIEKRRLAIEKEIDRWRDKLYQLQSDCEHKYVVKVNRGSSGDWEEVGQYWRECKCPECGSHWNEDQ